MFGFTRLIAHAAFPAPVVFTSEGLFFAGMGAAVGAYWVAHHREGPAGRVAMVGLGLAAAGCFSVATVLPFIIGPSSLSRPASTGQLAILSPRNGEIFRGDPAAVPVSLSLSGATIVPVTTIHVVPNQGHVHLYLDGSIVAMTGLQTSLSVVPVPTRCGRSSSPPTTVRSARPSPRRSRSRSEHGKGRRGLASG